MMGQYFYWQQIRRAVTVFGSLFNNISVVKRDDSDNVLQTIKVPLSYGPKQKFISRIRQEFDLNDPKVAIRLPRMSFEITSLEYDESSALQKRLNRNIPGEDPDQSPNVFLPVTYNLSFQLNIIGKHTDDCLQILEQILPFFKPEYTVTVKEVDNNIRTNMPFALSSVSMDDDYEGEFTNRRSLIYTLVFNTKVNFYGPINKKNTKVIKKTRTTISDRNMPESGSPFTIIASNIDPITASIDDEFTIETVFDFNIPNAYQITFDQLSNDLTVGENVMGMQSGSIGYLKEFDSETNTALITIPDGKFDIDEVVEGSNSQETFRIVSLQEIWNTANE